MGLDTLVTVTNVTQKKSPQPTLVPSVTSKSVKSLDGWLIKILLLTLFSWVLEEDIWHGDGSMLFQLKSMLMVKSVVMVSTNGPHLVPFSSNFGFSASLPCTCSPGKKANITDTRSTTGNQIEDQCSLSHGSHLSLIYYGCERK